MFSLPSLRVLTLSFTQDTNHHYPTLAHLNASSSVIIHRRDIPMVSFNSELNSTHFSFKISGLHEKSTGRPLGERASSTLFPQRGRQIVNVNRMVLLLFFPASLYCVPWQHTKGSYTLGAPGICHLITNWVAGKQREWDITHEPVFHTKISHIN